MSMYDNSEKDKIFFYMAEFLKDHSISELLEIITDVVERKEDDDL